MLGNRIKEAQRERGGLERVCRSDGKRATEKISITRAPGATVRVVSKRKTDRKENNLGAFSRQGFSGALSEPVQKLSL